MDWEQYLEVAVHSVADKYQARRYKAHFRAQLLERFEQARGDGVPDQQAMTNAMAALGDPMRLAERVAEPIRQQRGWLWLLSVSQLLIGISIVAVSLRTQSFAALGLGRIMALWGVLSTGFQTRRLRPLGIRMQLLQVRLMYARRRFIRRDFWRMAAVGFGTGILLALVASLPWSVVTANMFHPVFLSATSSLLLSGLVAGVPWIRLRRWLGQGFYRVTLQAWAALSAAIGATALILWHEAFAPPPLFNWQPDMLVAGGWVFNFALLRFVAALISFKERVLVGLDEEHPPLF